MKSAFLTDTCASVGADAANAGKALSDNPYSRYSQKGKDWRKGWRSVLLQGPRRPPGCGLETGKVKACLFCKARIYVIPSRANPSLKSWKRFCSISCSRRFHLGQK